MPDLAVRRARTVAALTLIGRCVRLTRRDTDALLMALALPVMIMLLFVYLFGGAIHTGTSYVTYVVPGVLLLCIGFGVASTAVSVSRDLAGGILDRFRAMDVDPAALLNGQVVASVARNAVATAVVLLVAVAIGFRPHAGAGQWLAAVGLLAAFVTALSWVAATAGAATRSPDAANGFSFFLSFLTYPSSAMVPVDTMPSWLQGFARNQPVTHVVESLRGLLLDRPVGSHPWWVLGWSAGLILVSVLLARTAFNRRFA
jgi:ABC-2 type transport system permease protein